MGGTDTDAATVLVVEDEESVAELFETVLSREYDVERVADGNAALDRLNDDIDVVLLDRHLPELSGDTVLEHIQSSDIDCRVAMVTGVDPDFDVIDMGFEDYLVKPVENQELVDTVDRLLALDAYQELQQELGAKLVKKNVIEAEKEPEELADHDEFQQLQTEIEELESELDAMEAEQEFDERLLPK